ncbi:uncharacterized protein LOC122855368 isoform X3 [Aphidius gifuensis]|uniref:uncharacterized protein LOC122855368 isoform X3 n=1 Tax=Aphidius gifuensis TaxID=684658 RepID=UPI001CDC3231|nr:uncharacterized protein LOC122855368 isoform X3 [Aphidius gifuensis]
MSPRSVKCARAKVPRKGQKVRGCVTRRLGERTRQERGRRNVVETMITGKKLKANDDAGAVEPETSRFIVTRTRQSLELDALDSAPLLKSLKKNHQQKPITADDIDQNESSADSQTSIIDNAEDNEFKISKESRFNNFKKRRKQKITDDNLSYSSTVLNNSLLSSSTKVSENYPLIEPKVNPLVACPSSPTHQTVTHAPLETLKNVLEGYDQSQIYLAHVSFLDWRDLPGKRTVTRERIWVVGAADHGGRHRTRLLVAGRHWRPNCLNNVNMITQPVIYAGGGSGALTADLFLWWFHREFATTAVAMHPNGAILVAEEADYLPPEIECITADGLVRLFIVPRDVLEPKIVANELRVRLAVALLTNVRSQLDLEERCERNLDKRIRRFTLKEAFFELHRAWLAIRSETFTRSWILFQEHEDSQTLPPPGPTLSKRPHQANHHHEDQQLIAELRELTSEVGLNVGDIEFEQWLIDDESNLAKCVKKEFDEDNINEKQENFNEFDIEDDAPNAKETVRLLSRVLLWMEREPLDPGLLLAVRSMRDTAALMASKMGIACGHPGGLPAFFSPNGDLLHSSNPPPAHMGIGPYGVTDAGKAAGLTRPSMYPFPTGQYPYPILSPESMQVGSWHAPSMYSIPSAGAGFRSPYPTSLPITGTSLPSELYRFSPTGLMPPHPGLSPHAHALASHALVSSAPKVDHSSLDHNHRSSIDQKNSSSLSSDNTKTQDTGQQNNQDKKKPHIKKPLNAFMLYMKEMRAKVVAECTLKESAAINQILGRRWHSLSREEQARYYEAARQERHLHQQRYPGWSARDNYGYGSKKKKRKKERSTDPTGGNNMKKCRARYGLDQQSQWCKPCRRKKKCIRYKGEGGDGDVEGDGDVDDDHSEDNLGSVGEAGTPEEDESLSSPGGLSALSSLASPSLVLPSPSSLASPCPCPLTPPVSQSSSSSLSHNMNHVQPQPHRNPVGTNPHDINNPLSVNQLTGQCIKSEVGPSNSAISVT